MKFFKCMFLLIILFGSLKSSNAQLGNYNSTIGGNIMLSKPIEYSIDGKNLGVGYKAKYIIMLNEYFGLLGELGYISYAEKGGKSNLVAHLWEGIWIFREDPSYKYSTIFIQGGIKINMHQGDPTPYFFSSVAILSVKESYKSTKYDFNSRPVGAPIVENSSYHFGLNSGFGIEAKLIGYFYLDASVGYGVIFYRSKSSEGITDMQSINLNFGINYVLF